MFVEVLNLLLQVAIVFKSRVNAAAFNWSMRTKRYYRFERFCYINCHLDVLLSYSQYHPHIYISYCSFEKDFLHSVLIWRAFSEDLRYSGFYSIIEMFDRMIKAYTFIIWNALCGNLWPYPSITIILITITVITIWIASLWNIPQIFQYYYVAKQQYATCWHVDNSQPDNNKKKGHQNFVLGFRSH